MLWIGDKDGPCRTVDRRLIGRALGTAQPGTGKCMGRADFPGPWTT